MKSTREEIMYDELEDGVHVIRHNTISKSNPDGTYSIFYKEKLVATLYFDGTVKIYPAGIDKSASMKKRYNLVLLPLNKYIVDIEKTWFVCNKGKLREEEVEPKLFIQSMVVGG